MSQCSEDCIEAVRQCRGSRLQDQRRFDLDDAVVSNRRDRIPAGSLPNLVGNNLFAAPRGENDVGRSSDHILWQNNTVFGGLLLSQIGKHLLATGDLDELRDPANAADERIVPLLEINCRLRPATNQPRHFAKASFIAPGKLFRLIRRSGPSPDGANHRENAGDFALIESMDGNAGADQLRCDRRLEIGKGEDEVGLEREDFWNIGRSKGRDARLVTPDPRWPHRVTGYPRDSVLLTEKVKGFDRLLCQADDSVDATIASRRTVFSASWRDCRRT
jgi:hypothetical protein